MEQVIVAKPWFRLYAEFISDPKVQLLAFEDQRHFVGILCLKCSGTLDSDVPSPEFRDRMIAKALGLSLDAASEARRRLIEIGLIGEDWNPVKWSDRQYAVKNLPEGESLEGYRGYVYFIGSDTLGTVKIGYSRNPWARVKELQTGSDAKLAVVATLKTTETSEVDVHKLFKDEKRVGEWFARSQRINNIINKLRAGEITNLAQLINVADLLRSSVVATQIQIRTDTEQNRTEKGADAPSRATRLPDDFALTPERRAVAEAERLHADRTFAEFCDYWRAASGQKARKCDWDATWRNWCRRQADFRPARQAPGRPSAIPDEWPELRARAAAIHFRDPREGESPQAYQTLLRRAEFEAAEAAKGSKPLRAALDSLINGARV